MRKKKRERVVREYALLPVLAPEGPDVPLRLCQNPSTGVLYLNRVATDDELAEITARLLPQDTEETALD